MEFNFQEQAEFTEFCKQFANRNECPGEQKVERLYNEYVSSHYFFNHRKFESRKKLYSATLAEAKRIEREMQYCMECEFGCLPCIKHSGIPLVD
jgi:hypothetical protein